MNFIERLEEEFQKVADQHVAQSQQAYMRHQFEFVGIPQPMRKTIQKKLFSGLDGRQIKQTLPALWRKQEREFRYTAIDLATKVVSDQKMLPFFRRMIVTDSWWDTVDPVASKLIGPLVLIHDRLRLEIDQWIDDTNMWIRRAALLHQLRYKEKTDQDRLFAYCTKRMHEDEFFIQKAIGWALREYSKTAPDVVHAFISTYEEKLSPLSVREGLKWLLR